MRNFVFLCTKYNISKSQVKSLVVGGDFLRGDLRGFLWVFEGEGMFFNNSFVFSVLGVLIEC
jgi:hypothetical protein